MCGRLLCFFLILVNVAFGQSGFHIRTTKEKVVVPFKCIDNLIFIPVTVNGVPLTFLLDTGVNQTVLFSLDEKEELQLNQVEKLKLKGLGNSEAVDAFRSSRNVVEISDFIDLNHEIYVILNQDFNFSSHVGIPVNGIIGYDFFKKHLVEIDYDKKKVTIYPHGYAKINKKLRQKFVENTITLEENKPYYIVGIQSDGRVSESKMLLDTGNSDALWIFLNRTESIQLPQKFIQDYLGMGFSGKVYGKRGKIEGFTFGNEFFEFPYAAFPDWTSVKSMNFVSNRVGSIGADAISRFCVIFDYENQKMYTRAGKRLKEPFKYNVSGIQVEHAGLEWVKETYEEGGNKGITINNNSADDEAPANLKVRFKLKPVFIIADLRPGSEAAAAGLEIGDKILTINNKNAQGYSMERVRELLKSAEGKTLEIEVERNGKAYQFKFQLKKDYL